MAEYQDDLDSFNERALCVKNEFLHCVSCNQQFDKDNKVPISLECLHIICRPCLKRMVDSNHELHCPECRKILTFEGEIGALSADFRIMKLMEVDSNKVKLTCFQHKLQPLNFFCRNCKTPICHDCTVINHPKERNHVIIDISDAFKHYAPEFNKLEQFSERIAEAMKRKVHTYKTELNELGKRHQALKQDILEKFNVYRALLNERENEIVQRADTLMDEQGKVIQRACLDLEKELKTLNILQKQFKIVRENNDIRLVFKEFNEFKDLREVFVYLVQPEKGDFFKKYIFTNEREAPLLDALNEAGEVELVVPEDLFSVPEVIQPEHPERSAIRGVSRFLELLRKE